MGWSYQQKPPSGWPLDYDGGFVPEAAFYLFDEGSGHIVTNLSGNGNTGTRSGTGNIWTSDKYGFAQEFNGSDDKITIPDSDVFSFGNGVTDKPFSIVSWVNLDTIGEWYNVLCKGDGVWSSGEYQFVVHNDPAGSIALRLVDDSALNGVFDQKSDAGHISTGILYQIAAVIDGPKSIKLYVDGKLVPSSISNDQNYTAMENTADDVFIGARATNRFFDGRISELLLYNRPLSAFEIDFLFQYPFCMYKDPAELLLNYSWVPTILPQITTAYMKVSA